MRRRLHLHFGIHRTGTTSIHRHLLGNLPVLNKLGICYPEMGVEHRHVKLAWKMISGKISPDETRRRLIEQVPEDAGLIILSSEDFSQMTDLGWIRLLAEEFEITASVYLKRQDTWLESWYNQNIKWPWDRRLSVATPDVFLLHLNEFHWIDYDALLERIASVVPRNSLYVNVIDSFGVTDTVMDFMRHCGIDMAILKPAEIENESISAARLDILRRIGLFKVKPAARRKIIDALKAMEITEDDGSKTVFDDGQVRCIMERYEASNRLVARKYFGRDELFKDPVVFGRVPMVVPDRKAYRLYIPHLLKEVASI